jgi:hypothetical protein
MTAREREAKPDAETDRLLCETLRDDLPADVEARLAGRLRVFLLSHRSDGAEPGRSPLEVRGSVRQPAVHWVLARAALGVAATLLVASGLGLQASAAPADAEPLWRINVSVSLFRALRGAPSVRCAGMCDAALDSPATLAESVYRRWVPVRVQTDPGGTLLATYRSTDPVAEYVLVLDAVTLLPREVIRHGGPAGAGKATCTWPATGARGKGEPR